MAIADDVELRDYCLDVARRAKAASAELALVLGSQKNGWLQSSARQLRDSTDALTSANNKDVAAAPSFGLAPAVVDRLRLTPDRIEGIAGGLEQIAALPDPVGEVMRSSVRPNGLEVQKVRVPLGVIFFVYESRPNVTADAAALCLKSGNAVILRGGKEAMNSSLAIAEILRHTAGTYDLPADAVQLVSTTDRDAVGHFLALPEWIDVAIPRGGEGLIRRVAAEAQMPVIKHFSGNCHVYVDRAADLDMARRIVINSKCQRMGVCNAAESLLVHEDIASELLPILSKAFADEQVEVRGDNPTCQMMTGALPATDDDYFTEYLGPKISAKVVSSLDHAIEHINHYGSRHTDAIVTQDLAAARKFTRAVDSSAVVVNASTRFNDGGEFGLGAEIGISTDKFHARGPCGLHELTSYKYVVCGDGQLRE